MGPGSASRAAIDGGFADGHLEAPIPRNQGANVTCLTELTATDVGPSLVFEGILNRAVFRRWMADRLAPILRPGQTVILDNLRVHKHRCARETIEAAGWFLRAHGRPPPIGGMV